MKYTSNSQKRNNARHIPFLTYHARLPKRSIVVAVGLGHIGIGRRDDVDDPRCASQRGWYAPPARRAHILLPFAAFVRRRGTTADYGRSWPRRPRRVGGYRLIDNGAAQGVDGGAE